LNDQFSLKPEPRSLSHQRYGTFAVDYRTCNLTLSVTLKRNCVSCLPKIGWRGAVPFFCLK